jgi:predicted DsbA family dithiol-disulfide isomerase
MPLEISIFSDVICPWCYVGKRRLDRALDQLGLRERAAITWLPFQLNPDMPPEGMERARYRAQKFGAERAAMFDRRLTDLGAEEGIPFAFEKIERTPNTARAHMLMLQAAEQGKADSLAEAVPGLFRARPRYRRSRRARRYRERR